MVQIFALETVVINFITVRHTTRNIVLMNVVALLPMLRSWSDTMRTSVYDPARAESA